jgi:tetratricopeptide (TPR) repeat protein
MKLLSENSFKKISKILFFAFLLTFAASADAQSINDDLQPKPKPPLKTAPRPKGTRIVKPRAKPAAKPVVKKPLVKNTPPVNNTPPGASTTSAAQPGSTSSIAAAAPSAIVVTPQTPLQIIERFMNFQQSANVTSKDWESVAAQTQSDSINEQEKAQHFIAQGNIAFNRADYSNALIQFNAAALALHNSSLPYYCIGKVYLVTKQPIQAEKAFEKAIKLNKTFALAYKGLGDALDAQGKSKKAQENYKEAARINVAGGNSLTVNSPSNKAENNSGAAMPADPTTRTTESVYELELKTARGLTAQKKWQSSLDKLIPLAKSNPTDDAYIAIGDNYFGMKQWLSALQAYKKAIELNGNSANAFYKSGLVYFETNEYQSAAEAFEKALIFDQNGMSINRAAVRKMADKASEKARSLNGNGKRKNFLGM